MGKADTWRRLSARRRNVSALGEENEWLKGILARDTFIRHEVVNDTLSGLIDRASGSQRTSPPYAEQHNRARHYGSRQGGWTSVDPLWPDESAYGYGYGNPTNWTDPRGLKCRQVPIKPSPSSGDRIVKGGCIALRCSFDMVGDIAKDLSKALNVSEDAVKEIVNALKKHWGKTYSPEDCCKAAHGDPDCSWLDLKKLGDWLKPGKARGNPLKWPKPECFAKMLCGSLSQGSSICSIVCTSVRLGDCKYRCDWLGGPAGDIVKRCKKKCGLRFDPSSPSYDASNCGCGYPLVSEWFQEMLS